MQHSNKEDTFASNYCLKCSQTREPCCIDPEAPIMISDIKAIMKKGKKLSEFVDIVEQEGKEGEQWWQDTTIEVKGKFYRLCLKINKEGCVFLKQGVGCTLSHERPLICKIFPFWVEEDGSLYYADPDNFCLITESKVPFAKAFPLIHETEKSIREYHRLIKEDCEKHVEENRKLVLQLLKEKGKK